MSLSSPNLVQETDISTSRFGDIHREIESETGSIQIVTENLEYSKPGRYLEPGNGGYRGCDISQSGPVPARPGKLNNSHKLASKYSGHFNTPQLPTMPHRGGMTCSLFPFKHLKIGSINSTLHYSYDRKYSSTTMSFAGDDKETLHFKHGAPNKASSFMHIRPRFL